MICRCVTESPHAGWIVIARHDDGSNTRPAGCQREEYGICPDCGGSLIAHCCEGMQTQPEPEERTQ
jgi:hypothetical protein